MIAELFDRIGGGVGSRTVLSGNGGARSAAELLIDVQALADWLKSHDTRVLAVLADNGVTWATTDLAALKAGIAHLPLPAFFSDAQLTHALTASGADMLFTDQPGHILALGLGFAETGQWDGLSVLRRSAAPASLPAGTAKISFTSGSTGTPKGVCLSAEGLLATARAVDSALSGLPIQRHLAVLPLALLLENVAGLYAPLLRGAEIILPKQADLGWRGMAGFDAIALARHVEDAQPSSLILVPELLKAWTLALEMTGRRAPAGLRFVAVGGARVDRTLLERARQAGLPAYEGYGLTECGSVVCLNRPGADRIGTVGQALDHVSIEMGDANEIRIRSRAQTRVFLGYLGDAAPSREIWPTGDVGRMDEAGFLGLSGRSKSLLITAYGRNISPEWVEAALTAQPEIAQAVVVGDDRPWLSAILVPAPGVDADGLAWAMARANAFLPDYARVGDWFAAPPFSPGQGLATGNGRPLRTAIAARYSDRIDALYLHPEKSHVLL